MYLYAASKTQPVATLHIGYGADIVKITDVIKTAFSLYDKNIVDQFIKFDSIETIASRYDKESANFITESVSWFDYNRDASEYAILYGSDPPYFTVPVMLSSLEDNNVYEAIVSTSLQFGSGGYFFSGDYTSVDSISNKVMYFDTPTGAEYFESENTTSANRDYWDFFRSQVPAYPRALNYMKTHPETFARYKVLFKNEDSVWKLVSIELV